jgi:hypothetical protein
MLGGVHTVQHIEIQQSSLMALSSLLHVRMNYTYLILQISIDPAKSFALYIRQFREKTEQMNSILETSNK